VTEIDHDRLHDMYSARFGEAVHGQGTRSRPYAITVLTVRSQRCTQLRQDCQRVQQLARHCQRLNHPGTTAFLNGI